MTKYSIDQFSSITGITKFVLRTWENRYGYLKAERTDSNIRLYTDSMLVRALNTNYLLENKVKISKIAKMTDLEVYNEVEKIKISDAKNRDHYYMNKIIDSAITFNTNKFHDSYDQGVKELGLIEFYKKVLLKTLHKIGILWLSNRVAPSQEHFLSELIKQKIAAACETKSEFNSSKETWLLFLPENEFHEIGLLFTKLILLQSDHNVIYLGANVPYGSLIHISQNLKVDNTVLFSISNNSKSNLDFTIKYLESNFKKASHYVIANDVSLDISTTKTKVKIINSIDQFLKLV